MLQNANSGYAVAELMLYNYTEHTNQVIMTNTPQAWNLLRSKVQAATAHLSDADLTDRVAQLQRRWRDHKRGATWNVLQELHTEQHRRRWA